MQSRKAIFILILSAFSINSIAQKIKYKDLYPLLASKSYEVAIPQLKSFLALEENKNEPNANLQMGIWLHGKTMKIDQSESEKLNQSADSAIMFLNKAKSLIDEKEIKKRDEYYQAFKRRDLRTGKFTIKVSDVHLDIEKKIEELENLKD